MSLRCASAMLSSVRRSCIPFPPSGDTDASQKRRLQPISVVTVPSSRPPPDGTRQTYNARQSTGPHRRASTVHPFAVCSPYAHRHRCTPVRLQACTGSVLGRCPITQPGMRQWPVHAYSKAPSTASRRPPRYLLRYPRRLIARRRRLDASKPPRVLPSLSASSNEHSPLRPSMPYPLPTSPAVQCTVTQHSTARGAHTEHTDTSTGCVQ